MKFVFKLILLLHICLYYIKIPHLINCNEETPTVSVNYIPKKQWKMSKLDLADIKLDIEREVKILNYLLIYFNYIWVTAKIKNITSTNGLGE